MFWYYRFLIMANLFTKLSPFIHSEILEDWDFLLMGLTLCDLIRFDWVVYNPIIFHFWQNNLVINKLFVCGVQWTYMKKNIWSKLVVCIRCTYFIILFLEGLGRGLQALSVDQADFVDLTSFLSSNLMKEISPNSVALSANTQILWSA